MRVWEAGGDEDQAIAALLHDAVEDQGPSFDGGSAGLRAEIRVRYGQRVLDIVDACTDADTVPKPPWRERKERYIAHVAEMPNDAVLVSVADKLHNARAILNDYRTIGERLWDRFNGGRDGTLWYYKALVEAFSRRTDAPLLHELRAVVAELSAAVPPPK